MTSENKKYRSLGTGRTDEQKRQKLVVIGAGFGGLNALHVLGGKEDVEVLVLDHNNYHGFWPLLYQVATAALTPNTIAYPVREITKHFSNINFQMAEVQKVDLTAQQVITDAGPISYDYLILAAGSSNNYFGNSQIPNSTYSLKDLDQAVALRQHLLIVLEQAVRESDFSQRQKLLTFVVVGAGPTGVELCGAFADLLQPLIHKQYPTLNETEIQIKLVEAHDTMLNAFPPGLQKKASQHLQRMGVTILQNSKVIQVEDGLVTFDNGQSLEAGTVVWAAGVKAAELGASLGIKLAHSDRVPVTPTLNLADHPEVFVVGDMAYLEGYQNKAATDSKSKPKKEAYPMVAEVAMQMGRRAAHNILADVSEQPMKPFKYTDLGTMSTIGRKDAVVYVFGFQLSGLFAWLSWLCVHLLFLVGFRNRVLVLLGWAYDYLTYNRGVRLIGSQRDNPATQTEN